MADPPACNNAGENGYAQPIEKQANHNQRMQPDEYPRFKNDRQRDRGPNASGETQIADNTGTKEVDVEPRHQCEQTSDADRSQNMKQAGGNVTARSFSSPSVRRFTLISMKHHTHPKPGCKNRCYACDQARNNGYTQRTQIAADITRRNLLVQPFMLPDRISLSIFSFRITFSADAAVYVSSP